MLEFLGGTYGKQLSIMRREAPRNKLLMRLAGADLGWSRGQRVSSTLRPREACWSMQRRHGVPESLNQQRQAGTHPAQGSQDNVGTLRSTPTEAVLQEAGLETVADRHDAAALCLYDRWRGLPGETTGERWPRGG